MKSKMFTLGIALALTILAGCAGSTTTDAKTMSFRTAKQTIAGE